MLPVLPLRTGHAGEALKRHAATPKRAAFQRHVLTQRAGASLEVASSAVARLK